jgi:thymidine phosphorylase
MNQPLGRGVGHSIEVRECIKILRDETEAGAESVRELSLELAARMVALAGIAPSLEAARARVETALESGAALECFRQNIVEQGGDPNVCENFTQLLPLTPHEVKVESTRNGFVTKVDTAEIGFAIAEIGGGRIRIEDKIDPAVGFAAEAKIGDQVKAGEALGVLYCRDGAQAQVALERIRAAYKIGDEQTTAPTLIKEVITA